MSNITQVQEQYAHVASFDIGKKNFAFCIEKFDVLKLQKIKNIPKIKRYNPNGSPTPKMAEILNNIFMNGEIILHKNYDLTNNCDHTKKLDPESFHNMNDILNKYLNLWDKCIAFVIEEQMNFGKKRNTTAVKLGQHCYSYFTLRYGRTREIFEFPSYHKTQVLGAPKVEGKPYKNGKIRWKSMDGRARKKWSVVVATEILGDRDELAVLKNLTTSKKRDDLADVLTQLQAFKYLVYVNKKL